MASDPGPTRSRVYQNVLHWLHEYHAIAQVLPDIGATCVAHSGQSISCGGFTGKPEGNLDAGLDRAQILRFPAIGAFNREAILVAPGKFWLGLAP